MTMNHRSPSKHRHFELVRILRERPNADIEELVGLLKVSPATVRRDLAELEAKGMVHRVMGGAVLVEQLSSFEPTFDERAVSQAEAKRAIGAAAAGLVEDGDVLFVDGGTTAEYMIEHLRDLRDLTVITYGINIAVGLQGLRNCKSILVGGEIDAESHTVAGALAMDLLDHYGIRCTKAFICATAVSAASGATNHLLEIIPIKRKAMAISEISILVADGSKLGSVSMGRIGPLSSFRYVITNKGASPEELESMRACGPELLLV